MLEEVFTHAFRVAHREIIGVNLVLSGARLVIALQPIGRPAAFSSGL